MKNILQIAQQTSPTTNKPWFLVETTLTTDGPRSRLCSGRWATEAEAQADLDRRQEALIVQPDGAQ